MDFSSQIPLYDDLPTGLADEMALRWRKGERPLAEAFLDAHPELWQQPELALELIYEEISLRQEFAEEVSGVELLARFPQWSDQLQALLGFHRLLEPGADSFHFPAVGESLGEFRLLAELGRGAKGRVFLAIQTSLADRPVVLKLTPSEGQEHWSLARLQHTHIVPLYSVQEDPNRNLRILCMPYFGTTTLAKLLQTLAERIPAQPRGEHLLQVLEEAQAAMPVPLPARGRARQFLARASYVQAICWIGACLAEALQYAHERGVVHLDLKPSNVLLGGDGQPMLLDFHLAREPIRLNEPAPEWLGGTLPYMSPEQRLALTAAKEGRKIPAAVDGRSDIYSLGLVLYEALAGKLPVPSKAPPPLYLCNPQVSLGLADLVAKCLESDPCRRYPDAGTLAADLRRHLDDLPLQGVVNRSLPERWRKWRRRRPYAFSLTGMLVAVLIAAGAVGIVSLAHFRQQLNQARLALDQGQQQVDDGHFAGAIETFKRGIALAEATPGSRDLGRQLADQLRIAARAQAAAQRVQAACELHKLADQIRLLYGVDFLPLARLGELEAHCRAFWEKRSLITESLGQDLKPRLKCRLQTDLLDLAILWTDLRVGLASAQQVDKARKEALSVLDQAEAMFGPSPVLSLERRIQARALGMGNIVSGAGQGGAEPVAQTAWEHYALGRSFLRSGDLARASAELQRAIDLQPQDMWPHFYQGICAYRLKRYQEAVIGFTVCVTLAHEVPGFYYNRALAYEGSGSTERAFKDYDRALQLDSTLSAAALNRGMLHYQQKQYLRAAADLNRALENGADPAIVHYDLALVSLARKDRAAALANLERSLHHNSTFKEARELLNRLQTNR